MAKQPNDKNKRQQDQQAQQRIDEQQQHQDRVARKPDEAQGGDSKGGQGGQSHTNRSLGERHPTSGIQTEED